VRAPSGDAGRLDDPHRAEPRAYVNAIASKWAKGTSGPAGDEHHNLTVSMVRPGRDVRGLSGGSVSPHDPKPDGPRYAACGDAVTANVAQWLGERLLRFG
jgi:hypothetical protein